MNGIELIYDKKSTGEIKVELPTSKSMAARALVIGAFAGVGPSEIGKLPVCTDTQELSSAINSLLAAIRRPDERMQETAASPICLSLNLGLGGTSLRFFTALASSIPATEIEIDCAAPLKKRPLAPLCEALITAGADISYLENAGYPPLLIKGTRMPGGERGISAAISSQFVSAMIMCAPYWKDGLQLHLSGNHPVSVPYIDMTARMMSRAGADVTISSDHRRIDVRPGRYEATNINLLQPEADWSAASYMYELALLLPDRPVRIASLTSPTESLQGDSACEKIFASIGVETHYHPDGSATLRCNQEKLQRVVAEYASAPVELDMSDCPDLVPALAVGLCLAGIHFRISKIGHLRHKESDRIAAISNELEKIGYALYSEEDSISWTGRRTPVAESESIETYHDHRIAMAFSIAAVKLPYLSVLDPNVTEKSFPDYFKVLAKAGFKERFF